MKLGIILCDDVQDALRPAFGNYDDMFKNLMAKVETGVELTFYSAVKRELPNDIDSCDGYMTSGSKWGVNDDAIWIHELEQFIVKLHAAKKGLVGICFGHQLIAKALGGQVQRAKNGWAVGVSRTQLVNQKKWMTPTKKGIDLIVSHQDQITDLPKNAELLFSNSFCKYSMFQVGQHFLGIQGHPEFSKDYSYTLMDSRKDRIPEKVRVEGAATLNYQVDDVCVTQWIVTFLQQSIVITPRSRT